MLDVMNPSEVLGHHAGRAESNTFRLSLDGGVSTTMLSSSPTVAMGQHAGRDDPIGGVSHHAGRVESNTFKQSLDGVSTTMLSSSPTVAMGQHVGRDKPIGGIAKMVHLKDFVDGKRRYLALVDREDDLPQSGTCLAVRPSLLRPGNRADSLVNCQNFRKSMSTVIKLDNMDAYVLHNMIPDRAATNDKPPLLGRSIVRCNKMEVQHCEATGNGLKMFCLDMETFSNFVQFGHEHPTCGFLKAGFRQQTHSIPWLVSFPFLCGTSTNSVVDRYLVEFMMRLCQAYIPCVPILTRASDAFRKLMIPYSQHIARLFNVQYRKKGVSAQQLVDFWCKRSISYSAPVKRKRYSGSNFFKDVEACRVIHEGSGAKVGCTMLNKNKTSFLFDDGNLDHTQMSYLSSLRSGYVSLRHYDSFFIEPYLPYRFSRQFGFCQDIPSAITRKLLLFQGSMSRVCAPYITLTNVARPVESSSPNLKRVSPHDEARDAHRSADGHASQHEGTGDNALDEVEGEDKSTSDAESEINFKTPEGRRSKKPRTGDLEGDETDFKNAFENIPIPSDIPIDLTQEGDLDFETGASFNIDDAMIGEATEPRNVLTDRPNPGKGKDIHMERDLVERSNPASPVQTHHSFDGLLRSRLTLKTLGIPLDAKGIPRAPSHGDAVPAPPISTIRITPASQGIFTLAIRILGMSTLHYLSKLPLTRSLTDMEELLKCTRLSE
ncbi:DNA-directed RNA polymerase subunit beta' [Bienertia sinuspersici]